MNIVKFNICSHLLQSLCAHSGLMQTQVINELYGISKYFAEETVKSCVGTHKNYIHKSMTFNFKKLNIPVKIVAQNPTYRKLGDIAITVYTPRTRKTLSVSALAANQEAYTEHAMGLTDELNVAQITLPQHKYSVPKFMKGVV